jgi:TonB family protein
VVETAPAPAVPAGPTPEELQAQIEALVAEQTKAVAEGFKQQQEAQIKALQDQLKQAQDAQKQAAERAAQQEAERIAAAEKAAAEAAKKPEPTQVAEAKPTEPETKAPAPTTTVAETKPSEPATKAPPASTAPAPAPVPPPTAAAPVTTSRPAATAAVRTGDLVTIGPNVSAPKLIKRPVTRFPEMARRMNQRQATVRLRVLVDENGKVIDSQLAGAEVGYGFDREALRAAQSAEFDPAKTKDGVRVKVWFPLAIEFRG